MKTRKRSILLLLICIIFVNLLVACDEKNDDGRVEQEVTEPTIVLKSGLSGIEHCEAHGYTTEHRSDDDCDNYFTCIFPDGSECHSGLFLNGRCAQSFTYCEQQGNELSIVQGGSVPAICLFPDGSYCPNADYLMDDCNPGELFLDN